MSAQKKLTSKDLILRRLEDVGRPLAVHELQIFGYSENSIATRLSELAQAGKVIGLDQPGVNFKRWRLTNDMEKTMRPTFLAGETKDRKIARLEARIRELEDNATRYDGAL